MANKNYLKYVSLIGLSGALTALTVVFGAIPMLALRRAFGRRPFWVGMLALVVGLIAIQLVSYAVVVLALSLLVGVYIEAEEHGSSIFVAGMVGVLASLGMLALSVGIWLQGTKVNLFSHIRTELAPVVASMASMNPQAKITVDSVMQHLPAGILMGLISALALALISERPRVKTAQQNENGPQAPSAANSLQSFRVPDPVVWAVVASVFGSFYQHDIAWVQAASTNLLYVLVVVYFFQGLAVAAAAFKAMEIGPFWRAVWYVLIVLQLFLLVSLIGFADYWLDFRTRLARKPVESNKQI